LDLQEFIKLYKKGRIDKKHTQPLESFLTEEHFGFNGVGFDVHLLPSDFNYLIVSNF
jgi:hypothetical protein